MDEKLIHMAVAVVGPGGVGRDKIDIPGDQVNCFFFLQIQTGLFFLPRQV